MRLAYFAATMTFTGAILLSCAAQAWDQDPVSQYLQRSNKITLSAGNAKEVNAATQVIDPWPPYVGNRRIPGNGERMVSAIERYRNVYRIPLAPRPIFTPVPSGAGAGAGAGGGAVAGAAPAP
jgi:hypothetical protein